LVATPLLEESLRASQGDRLSEAHGTDERSNICIALPNRLAKVRLGVRKKGVYLFALLFPKILEFRCYLPFCVVKQKTTQLADIPYLRNVWGLVSNVYF